MDLVAKVSSRIGHKGARLQWPHARPAWMWIASPTRTTSHRSGKQQRRSVVIGKNGIEEMTRGKSGKNPGKELVVSKRLPRRKLREPELKQNPSPKSGEDEIAPLSSKWIPTFPIKCGGRKARRFARTLCRLLMRTPATHGFGALALIIFGSMAIRFWTEMVCKCSLVQHQHDAQFW